MQSRPDYGYEIRRMAESIDVLTVGEISLDGCKSQVPGVQSLASYTTPLSADPGTPIAYVALAPATSLEPQATRSRTNTGLPIY